MVDAKRVKIKETNNRDLGMGWVGAGGRNRRGQRDVGSGGQRDFKCGGR